MDPKHTVVLHTVVIWRNTHTKLGFSGSSADEETACSAGDSDSIPGSGRSTGEGTGYPLQYSRTSLVAQLIKIPPAMQETWVWSLGWEDPLGKGKATHSSILTWRIPCTCSPWGHKLSDTTERFHSLFIYQIIAESSVCGNRKIKSRAVCVPPMWERKTLMNLSMKWKQIHRHREQTCSCQCGGEVGEDELGFGTSRYKVLKNGSTRSYL